MCGRWLDDCGAPKYFTTCSLSHRPAASGGRVLPKNVPKHRQHRASQSTLHRICPGGGAGRRFRSRQLSSLWLSATAPPSAFLRALKSIQDLHDLLLDDLCGVAGVWYQISGQREDEKTEEGDQYYKQHERSSPSARCEEQYSSKRVNLGCIKPVCTSFLPRSSRITQIPTAYVYLKPCCTTI